MLGVLIMSLPVIHFVDPRTGPNNAGTPACVKCGAQVFQIAGDGSGIALLPMDQYTTDAATWATGAADSEGNAISTPCSPA